jgi:hypothetical protein
MPPEMENVRCDNVDLAVFLLAAANQEMPVPPCRQLQFPFACPPSPSSSSSSNPSSYRLPLPNIHPSSVSLQRHSDRTDPTVYGNQHRSPSRFPVTNNLRRFHHTLFHNTPHPHPPSLPTHTTDPLTTTFDCLGVPSILSQQIIRLYQHVRVLRIWAAVV